MSNEQVSCIIDELKNSIRSKYVEAQEKFIEVTNLKVGDKVKVYRKSFDHELGWGNVWNEDMDGYVGKFYTIQKFCRESGIKFEDEPYAFPFFVLEKVEEPCKFKDKDIVLVRDDDDECWQISAFKKYDGDFRMSYRCYGSASDDTTGWKQCVLYKGHEHLLGTKCPADC